MTHKFFSLAFLAASFFGAAGSALAATNVTVVLKSGQQQVVKLQESGFIYFADGQMLVHPSAEAVSGEAFPLSGVRKMTFSENSSVARVLGPGQMALYPSVAVAEVFLANAPSGSFRADVYNVGGALVASQVVSAGQAVSVAALPAGSYFLKANGSTFKFLKK